MRSAQEQSLLKHTNELISKRKFTDAISLLYPALKQYPSLYQAWLLFSRCLYEVGHLQEALQVAEHAERIDPLKSEYMEIQQCMQSRQFTKAADLASQMLLKEAHHPRAYFTIAHAALSENNPELSCQVLAKNLEYLPVNFTLRKLLIDSYVQAGQFANAIEAAKRMVSLQENFDTLWLLAGLLFKYGQYESLLECCQRSTAIAAQDRAKLSQILLTQGQALRILGRRKESIEAFQQCLRYDELNADAWWALADFKNYVFSDTEHTKLASLLKSNLPPEKRCIATFALAKLRERAQGADAAMVLYEKANALKNCSNYSTESMVDEFEQRIKIYNRDWLRAGKDVTSKENRARLEPIPIFIVGLPRSGSTLLEQMLASHDDIEGTLEQVTLPSIERRAERLCKHKYNTNLISGLEKLSDEDLHNLGNAYLEEGQLFRTSKRPFFIDKQPFNFRLVGLIHRILPKAIIIDIRRNPMDCGLSLYRQYFHSGVEFSYSFEQIACAYKAYIKLMEYWQSALPNKVMQLDFEDLVAEPQQHITRVLNHIGLEYDDNCLDFHNTKRPIHTASSEQVREPLNSNGIGAWRKVEAHLCDLKKNLGTLFTDDTFHR